MNQTMWISLAGILITNVILVIGATWRLSGVITKVIIRLDSINEKMELNSKHMEHRLTTCEATIATQNITILDLQKRQTTMELEMKLMPKVITKGSE
jgi:hypothetical protein